MNSLKNKKNIFPLGKWAHNAYITEVGSDRPQFNCSVVTTIPGVDVKKCVTITCLIVVLFSNVPQASEIFSNARQYALGGAYSAMGQGAEAIFTNPANIYLDHKKKFSMSFLGVGAELSNNSISHTTYETYSGAYLDSTRIGNILGDIPDEGFNLRSDIKLQGLSIGIGPVALGFRAYSTYSGLFARELFELALRGNELERTYDFSPVKVDGMTIAAGGLAIGHSINVDSSVVKNVGFGLNVRYLHGLTYNHITDSDFNSTTTYASLQGRGHISMESAQGGAGYGVTVGTSVTLFTNLRASVVLENIISGMEWTENVREESIAFHVDQEGLDALLDSNGTNQKLVDVERDDIDLEKISMTLPSILRLGLMIPLHDEKWYVNTEYEQIFNQNVFLIKPRFAAGAEYLPNSVFRFRFGASFGGNYENHYSGGMGIAIGKFCWDIAFRTYNGITSWASKGFGVAMNVAIRY